MSLLVHFQTLICALVRLALDPRSAIFRADIGKCIAALIDAAPPSGFPNLVSLAFPGSGSSAGSSTSPSPCSCTSSRHAEVFLSFMGYGWFITDPRAPGPAAPGQRQPSQRSLHRRHRYRVHCPGKVFAISPSCLNPPLLCFFCLPPLSLLMADRCVLCLRCPSLCSVSPRPRPFHRAQMSTR
jgi:hypothetical protein